MPPWIPPLRFVRVRTLPPRISKASLCSLPFCKVPAKPLPISKPFVAGSESIAFASSASSLSNTGSPHPGGTPRIAHSITPPTLSPSLRTCLMNSIIFTAIAGSGHRTMFASTSASFTVSGSTSATSECTDFTYATISSAGANCASTFFAMAAAATRPIVSRAEARPPPCQFRMPNFA